MRMVAIYMSAKPCHSIHLFILCYVPLTLIQYVTLQNLWISYEILHARSNICKDAR